MMHQQERYLHYYHLMFHQLVNVQKKQNLADIMYLDYKMVINVLLVLIQIMDDMEFQLLVPIKWVVVG